MKPIKSKEEFKKILEKSREWHERNELRCVYVKVIKKYLDER